MFTFIYWNYIAWSLEKWRKLLNKTSVTNVPWMKNETKMLWRISSIDCNCLLFNSWVDLVLALNVLICWCLLKSTGFSINNLICSPVGSIYSLLNTHSPPSHGCQTFNWNRGRIWFSLHAPLRRSAWSCRTSVKALHRSHLQICRAGRRAMWRCCESPCGWRLHLKLHYVCSHHRV